MVRSEDYGLGVREGSACELTSCLVVKDPSEMLSVREDVGLVGQIGATGVDEVYARKLYKHH